MTLGKRIKKSRAVNTLVTKLLTFYLRLCNWTTHWDVINPDVVERFDKEDTPVIGSCWHGRIALMPFCYHDPTRGSVLISRNRDGEIIANVMHALKLNTIRGSSAARGKENKGGSQALRAMLQALQEKQHIFFTPDGPRGPRMRVTDGIITLARLSGNPIIPMTFSVKRRKIASSWDRFLFPLPFTKGVFAFGEPLFVPRDADESTLSTLRDTLEHRMNDLVRQADESLGVEAIGPEPIVEPANAT